MQDSLLELIQSRRSIRGFQPDPVPTETLERIFSTAQRAPSNCNTQPWKTCVVSGDTCDRLRQKLGKAFIEGKGTMDFPYDGIYQGVYKERQRGAGAALYGAMGIDRKDKPARQQQFMDNFRFFDAPHAAFLFIPEEFGIREAADIGMYAQSLMLSMQACGVASCPQTILSFCANTVREELEVEDQWKLLFGISFGYEDKDNPANQCHTDRATLDEAVTFYS